MFNKLCRAADCPAAASKRCCGHQSLPRLLTWKTHLRRSTKRHQHALCCLPPCKITTEKSPNRGWKNALPAGASSTEGAALPPALPLPPPAFLAAFASLAAAFAASAASFFALLILARISATCTPQNHSGKRATQSACVCCPALGIHRLYQIAPSQQIATSACT